MIQIAQGNYNNQLLKQNAYAETTKYITPVTNAFEICSLESMEQDRIIHTDQPVQFKNFEILWIQKGAGIITVDLQDHSISDNMIVCISPGQLFLLNAYTNLEGYRISFSPDFLVQTEGAGISFTDACYDTGKVHVIFPDSNMQNEVSDIVQLMNREFKNYLLQRSQILKGFFKIFLIHLVQHMKTNEPYHSQERDICMVRKFMALIKENFLTKKMVSDYASELFVSPNYLNRIVKKVSGHTASYHIQQLIVLEAKRQAIYSGLSMKEVAYSLGFNDYAHFSKFFKNNSGMNFTCFKNGLGKNN